MAAQQLFMASAAAWVTLPPHRCRSSRFTTNPSICGRVLRCYFRRFVLGGAGGKGDAIQCHCICMYGYLVGSALCELPDIDDRLVPTCQGRLPL